MKSLGVLYALDCWGCRFCPITPEVLTDAVLRAAREAGLEVVEQAARAFTPDQMGKEYGGSVITLIVPMRQSHIALHTWPARRFISIDFYTCADPDKGQDAVLKLAAAFGPARIERNVVWRGVFREGGKRV